MAEIISSGFFLFEVNRYATLLAVNALCELAPQFFPASDEKRTVAKMQGPLTGRQACPHGYFWLSS